MIIVFPGDIIRVEKDVVDVYDLELRAGRAPHNVNHLMRHEHALVITQCGDYVLVVATGGLLGWVWYTPMRFSVVHKCEG